MRARGLNQPLEGLKAIASLGAGSVVAYVVYMFGNMLLPQARDAAPGGYGGIQMNDWFKTILDLGVPLAFLGAVFFGLIAAAVFARRYR